MVVDPPSSCVCKKRYWGRRFPCFTFEFLRVIVDFEMEDAAFDK